MTSGQSTGTTRHLRSSTPEEMLGRFHGAGVRRVDRVRCRAPGQQWIISRDLRSVNTRLERLPGVAGEQAPPHFNFIRRRGCRTSRFVPVCMAVRRLSRPIVFVLGACYAQDASAIRSPAAHPRRNRGSERRREAMQQQKISVGSRKRRAALMPTANRSSADRRPA